MNNRASLQRIEALVDNSGFVTTLLSGIEREPQGLKTNSQIVRLLVIGLLLSIKECKSATITGAYEVLTTHLDIRDQLRLGIKTGPGPKDFIARARLYYAADLLTSRLAYGNSVAAEIGKDEVERRRDVVLQACYDLFDYTATATDVNDKCLAIDSTAVWAWNRGKYYPKPTASEIAAQEDDLIREELTRLARGKGDVSDLEDVKVTDDSSRLAGHDVDAAWSGATAKNGGLKRFFGYYAHLICAVPSDRLREDPRALAPIVRRVELTMATKNVVDVSLRMLRTLPRFPKRLLADRHFSYKKFFEWLSPLINAGTRQVHDLRKDDHKVIFLPEGIGTDGFLHCPGMPRHFLGKHRPGLFAKPEEHEQFQREMAERSRYAYIVIEPMVSDGRTKLRCPARKFKVACPLFPPSMEVAAEKGLPIINLDLLDLEPGEELPRCCAQDSFWTTLPEPVAKLNQSNYWGTKKWYDEFDARTYVEGVFGNIKNPRTENLSRGTIQKTGIVWSQLVVSLMCATYNVRIIRERHERMGRVWEGHALLTPDEDTVTHVSLTTVHEQQLFADFADGVSLEELEVRPSSTTEVLPDASCSSKVEPRPARSMTPFWLSANSTGNAASRVRLR